MRPNTTKQKLAAGDVVIGTQIQQFRSTETGRTLAASGVDFIWVDAEHGPFDPETIHDMVRAIGDAGATPIVRVGEFAYSLVARALDSGAQGVILPRATSVPQLADALSWTRFPTAGVRGYGLSGPHVNYEKAGMRDIIAHVNANTLSVVQFENAWAIEHCDELLALPNLDVALVGPADLSISLGVPGEFDHPSLIAAVTRLVEACTRHAVAPGIHLRAAALADGWIRRGMRFVSVGSDHGFLLERATEVVGHLKKVATPQPGRT